MFCWTVLALILFESWLYIYVGIYILCMVEICVGTVEIETIDRSEYGDSRGIVGYSRESMNKERVEVGLQGQLSIKKRIQNQGRETDYI